MVEHRYLLESIQAAIKAGKAILEVYHSSDFKVEEKADKSPLTLADRRSHEILVNCLQKFDIPILSEEGKNVPYEERKKWETYWLIDPLDGTKEFIKRNGEFTVNIALIIDQKPVAGVIYVPDKNTLFFASTDLGSFRTDPGQIDKLLEAAFTKPASFSEIETRKAGIIEAVDHIIDLSKRLPTDDALNRPYTIIGSRSHGTAELEAIVEEKRREFGDIEFISAGSSLKLCRVAEGRADIYPRTGPTMEWDTAAGQAIVENAGGRVYQYDTQDALIYNKENLLNPWFVALKVK